MGLLHKHILIAYQYYYCTEIQIMIMTIYTHFVRWRFQTKETDWYSFQNSLPCTTHFATLWNKIWFLYHKGYEVYQK